MGTVNIMITVPSTRVLHPEVITGGALLQFGFFFFLRKEILYSKTNLPVPLYFGGDKGKTRAVKFGAE